MNKKIYIFGLIAFCILLISCKRSKPLEAIIDDKIVIKHPSSGSYAELSNYIFEDDTYSYTLIERTFTNSDDALNYYLTLRDSENVKLKDNTVAVEYNVSIFKDKTKKEVIDYWEKAISGTSYYMNYEIIQY